MFHANCSPDIMLRLLLYRMYPNFILLVFRQLHVYCAQSLTFISFHYHSWHHFSRMIECVQYSFERNERISINNNDSGIQLLIHYLIEWYHDLYVILVITHKIKNVNISLEILGQFVFFYGPDI